MHSPIPTRLADLPGTSLRDLPAGDSHLTPLIHARIDTGEPEPVGRLRADAPAALVCRWALATAAGGHATVTAATTGLEIDDARRVRRSGRLGEADPRYPVTRCSVASSGTVRSRPRVSGASRAATRLISIIADM
jgi:hypothetical protein